MIVIAAVVTISPLPEVFLIGVPLPHDEAISEGGQLLQRGKGQRQARGGEESVHCAAVCAEDDSLAQQDGEEAGAEGEGGEGGGGGGEGGRLEDGAAEDDLDALGQGGGERIDMGSSTGPEAPLKKNLGCKKSTFYNE